MKINKLAKILNKAYPFRLKDDWDINYFTQQDPFNNKDVLKNLIICLDINDNIVEFAIKNKVNTIISHHPIFVGSETIKTLPYVEALAERLMRNHIQCIFLHTNFDKATNGMNNIIAKEIGLAKINFVNNKKTPAVIASVKKQRTLKELAQTLANVFPFIKVNYDSEVGSERVYQVAMIAGGGFSDLINLVQNKKWKKIDTFITSDVRWHNWLDARNCNIKVIDVTHSIENIFVREISKFIKKKVPNNVKIHSFLTNLKLNTLN